MIALIILSGLALILGIIAKLTRSKNKWNNDGSDECMFFSITFGIIFLLASCISFPCGRYNSKQNIREINTLKQTLQTQREQGLELENAAVISEIIKTNTYINEEKRDNSKWYWDWFIVDEIDTVQLVK